MLTYKSSGTPCICNLERRRKCHTRLLKVHHRLNFLKLYFISVYTSNTISGPKYLWILEFNKTDFLTHFEWLRSMFGKKLSFHSHTHTHTFMFPRSYRKTYTGWYTGENAQLPTQFYCKVSDYFTTEQKFPLQYSPLCIENS
jgi:hypothetical protein